jgi:cell division protein FtsW (lipid II flippase)
MTRRNAELALMILAGVIAIGAYLLTSFAGSSTIPAGLAPYALTLVALYAAALLAVRRFAPTADPILLPCAFALAGIGYAMVRRLDPNLAAPQLTWTAVGVALFCLTLAVVRDYRRLAAFQYTMLLIGVGLLMLPLAPVIGKTVRGARLWVEIGPLNFQPAEAAKIALALFLAGYLASKREVMTVATLRIGPVMLPAPRHFGPLVIAWGLSLAVMITQRDLGSSVLFLSLYVLTIYVATGRASYVVTGSGLFFLGAIFAYRTFAHVERRISAWLNPWSDINGAGFQIAQSLFAFGSGGMIGTGLGRGRPDLIRDGVSTDFIFSALGEELGLIGATAVLLLFAIIVARGLHIALRSRDQFGTLLALGLTVIVGVQTFLIVGGVTRLIPLTGITLPFVSYGGSSLVANFVLLALLMRVSDEEPAA